MLEEVLEERYPLKRKSSDKKSDTNNKNQKNSKNIRQNPPKKRNSETSSRYSREYFRKIISHETKMFLIFFLTVSYLAANRRFTINKTSDGTVVSISSEKRSHSRKYKLIIFELDELIRKIYGIP